MPDQKRSASRILFAVLAAVPMLCIGCVHYAIRELTLAPRTPSAGHDSSQGSVDESVVTAVAAVLLKHGFRDELYQYQQTFGQSEVYDRRRRIGFFAKDAAVLSPPNPIYCDVFANDSAGSFAVVVREKNGSREDVLASVVGDLRESIARAFPSYEITILERTEPGSVLDP